MVGSNERWASFFAAAATIVRGAGVGALATGADLLALVLLVRAGATPTAASLPALAIGVAVQFVGSKVFTFQSRSPAWAREAALFLLVEAAAFALNLAVFDWGVRHTPIPFALVRLLGQSVVYFGFSLPLWSFVFGVSRGRKS